MSDNAVCIICLTLLVSVAMMVTHSLEPLWLMFFALWLL